MFPLQHFLKERPFVNLTTFVQTYRFWHAQRRSVLESLIYVKEGSDNYVYNKRLFLLFKSIKSINGTDQVLE